MNLSGSISLGPSLSFLLKQRLGVALLFFMDSSFNSLKLVLLYKKIVDQQINKKQTVWNQLYTLAWALNFQFMFILLFIMYDYFFW